MFVFRAVFTLALLVPVASLAGCIGMRTPMDDAAVGDGARPLQVACGTTITIDTTPAQPDILILLDRSDSMKWSLEADDYCTPMMSNCSVRLAAVTSALGTIVTNNPKINWGLELFPTPNASSCSVSSTPQVAVSASAASAIRSQLAALTTDYSTPTRAVINAAVAYLKKVSDGRKKAILLATDGLPTCDGGSSWSTEDLAGAVKAAGAAKTAGFDVYVVGIGPNVSNLNKLAQAGGTGGYYPATSTGTLNTALQSIAKAASFTCTFKANVIPVDKELVSVYVDKTPVAKDDDNGWMFDPTDSTYSTVVLTGSYCQAMLAGSTSQVQIVFGCPEPDALP